MDELINFFFKKASSRIKNRIDNSDEKLKHSDIVKSDIKQISRIINLRITRNNAYLINDSVNESYYRDESTGEYKKCGLLHTKGLNFKSRTEILWGTKEEIQDYLQDLFLLFWNEVSSSTSPYNIDKDLYLSDYIPYAKYKAYWDILFSPDNKYPAITYAIREDDVIENIDSAEEEATLLLFKKSHEKFAKIFMEFTETTQSYHKINKALTAFIKDKFIPLIQEFSPDKSSLGLRVRGLIMADLSYCPELLFASNPDDYDYKYKFALNRASSNYIIELEQIQKTLYNNLFND